MTTPSYAIRGVLAWNRRATPRNAAHCYALLRNARNAAHCPQCRASSTMSALPASPRIVIHCSATPILAVIASLSANAWQCGHPQGVHLRSMCCTAGTMPCIAAHCPHRRVLLRIAMPRPAPPRIPLRWRGVGGQRLQRPHRRPCHRVHTNDRADGAIPCRAMVPASACPGGALRRCDAS